MQGPLNIWTEHCPQSHFMKFDCLTEIKTKHKTHGVPMLTFDCLTKIKTKHKPHGVPMLTFGSAMIVMKHYVERFIE